MLYATLLGSPTRSQRNADLAALLRWGLSLYAPVAVVDETRTYARAEVGFDLEPVKLVASRSIVRSARVDRILRERIVAATAVELPVRRGQRLGEVRVYDGTREVASSPLVAARTVDRPGFAARASWYAKRTVSNLWP